MFLRQINLALAIDFSHSLPMPYCIHVQRQSKAFHFFAPLSIAYLRSVKLFPPKSIKARRASFLNRGSQSILASLASFGRMVPRLAHLTTLLFIIPKTSFPQISPGQTQMEQLVHSSSHIKQHSHLPQEKTKGEIWVCVPSSNIFPSPWAPYPFFAYLPAPVKLTGWSVRCLNLPRRLG